MLVLGIETSCDETGVAVYDTGAGLLAHALHSQIDVHARFGGVVPELASRDHVRKLAPMLRGVLRSCDNRLSDIQGIAYTAGPGLVGALLAGAAFAHGLAHSLTVPVLGVHHMEGHLLAPMLETDAPEPPFVALLVSGGHTLLVAVDAVGDYRILGETLDDAAGEAFDKTAKLLGLEYPGGPRISELARNGNASRFRFPRPMTNRPGLDFSFSGLKTFTRTTFQAQDGDSSLRADIAAGFEAAICDTLAIKCRRAMAATGMRRLVVAGGVSANTRLRATFNQLGEQLDITVYYPRPQFCTDNGAMIAYAGALRLAAGQEDGSAIRVYPRWDIDSLPPNITR